MCQSKATELVMEAYRDGHWAKLYLDRMGSLHYSILCNHQDEGPGHGFMLEPLVLAFKRQGMDEKEGVAYCTGRKKDGSECRAELYYIIRHVCHSEAERE